MCQAETLNAHLEHFRELRRRLIISLILIGLAVLVCFHYYEHILPVLLRPLWQVMPEQHLFFIGLEEPFLVKLKISLWTGLILSSPLWLFQSWAFLGPALYRHEKKWLLGLCGLGILFFLAGAAMAYFIVLPFTIGFFVEQAGVLLEPLPAAGKYISLITKMIVVFGLVFQLPLLLSFLANTGLIDFKLLRKGRKYACLIIVIAAAVLTPPDVLSQVLLAIPMLLLYELGIAGAWLCQHQTVTKTQTQSNIN